jgi:hypothetical protein
MGFGKFGLGGIFGENCTILFFILVFLILFWDRCGCIDP